MSEIKKTPSGNNPVRKTPSSKAVDKGPKGRRTAFIIASVVIVLILIIVGVSLYLNAAPFRRIIITVDDTSIDMDYFLKRTRLADADSMVMLERLTNEQLIKIEAPRYGIEVSPGDIDRELRRMASGESETIPENEFKEWYRQLLNEIDLSDSEYKEIVTTNLLAAGLHEYLAERVPTVAEQVHLYTILLGTEDMGKLVEQWEAGEDTSEIATAIWQDRQSEETIEELGWLPRGILPSRFDEIAFNLSVGDVSEVVPYTADSTAEEIELSYYLFRVSEKAVAREIDEDSLQILKAKVLDDWLLEEIRSAEHEIGWYGLENGFDTETNAWINWQLSR